MASANDKRPAGFVPIGIFFYFGATMATYAAITLAVPGTFLDHAWKLNSDGHVGLAALGRIMAVPLLVLAAALFLAGLGWFRRRLWGWRFGVALIAINLAGDLYNIVFRRQVLKGFIEVVIAGLLLIYMSRKQVRSYFRKTAS
jgi:hypothetical protein